MLKEKHLSTEKTRIEYLDFLRVFATIAVIIIHAVSKKWYSLDVHGYDWQVLNVYDSMVRWSVPVFIMISGTLFLEQELDIKKLYTNKIFRLAVIYFLWSALYAVILGMDKGHSKTDMFLNFTKGHFHLWYLPAIIGVYATVPLLKKIAESETLIRYFLALSFLAGCVIPQLIDYVKLFSETLGKGLNYIYSDINIHMFEGEIFYFLLGYYLNKTEIKPSLRKMLYAAGLLCVVYTAVITAVVSAKNEDATSTFYGYYQLHTVVTSAAVFVFAKHHLSYSRVVPFLQKAVRKISACSLGIYVVHMLVYEYLNKWFDVSSVMFNPLLATPVTALLVFVCSFLITALIKCVPKINRYIV